MDKILVYALSENVGGVEEYVLNLSRYNSEHECEYQYIVLGDHTPYMDELEKLGVTYYYIPKKRKVFANIKALSNLFKKCREECDVIYFNTSALVYPIPYLLALYYNYRIVLHSHLTGTTGARKYIHYINRSWINKKCVRMMACSKMAGNWMFGNKNMKNVFVIPNAINLSNFSFCLSDRIRMRKELNLDNEFVIGHIGRLHSVKNQEFLINMLSTAKRLNINYKLLLVGDGADERKLKQLSYNLNVNDRVIFYGRTDKPWTVMNCMDCFVMPSLVEGFPVTLIEAQANGLPCIVSDTITQEVNVLGKVTFCSLKDDYSVWIKAIKDNAIPRYNSDQLKDLGYDVVDLERKVRNIILHGDCL